MRALRSAVVDKKEVYDLILSNIVYGITGNEEDLDLFAIDNEINDINKRIDENVALIARTEGDPTKYYDVISKMNLQIETLKSQADIIREKMKNDHTVSLEIARIKEIIEDESRTGELFNAFDDAAVKRLVEYVLVLSDKRIKVVLKGGLTIEERI